MNLFLFFLLVVSTVHLVSSYIVKSTTVATGSNVNSNRFTTSISIRQSYGLKLVTCRENKQPIMFDLFGLGPSEIIVIVGAAAFLYGPDRLKQQLRDSGVKGGIVSAGWKADRMERIDVMKKNASKARRYRAIQRIVNRDDDMDADSGVDYADDARNE